MGVLLTAAAIVAGVSVGVFAERRRPRAAALAARRSLVLMLYVLVPPVIFFNLAASEIDVEHGVGLLLGIVAVSLSGLVAWWVSSRVLGLARHRTGAVVCAVLSVNTGYLGYPLTVALLGRDQLSTAVLYDVLVTGPCLLLGAFAVGAAFGTKAGEGPRTGERSEATKVVRNAAKLVWWHPVEVNDVQRGIDLFETHADLDARDAIFAALALNRGIDAILTTDRAFDEVGGLERIPPTREPSPR